MDFHKDRASALQVGAEEEQVCEEEQAVTHGLYRKGSDVQEGVVYYKFIRSKKKTGKWLQCYTDSG